MSSRTVLITGASSGLGLEIARLMHRAGYIVYAAARSLKDGRHRDGYQSMKLDVTDEMASRTAVERVIAREGRLDILILAAGYGLAGSVEDTSPAEARDQLNTNFFGVVNFLPPAVAHMRSRNKGTIVFLGSVAGVLPIPFQAYYSAGKAALASLSLALAAEVKPYGIKCLLIQPGDTSTGFTDSRQMAHGAVGNSAYGARYRRSVSRMAADEKGGMSARKVAALILRQIEKRRPPYIYTPGLNYKIFIFLQRILPLRLVRMVISRIYAS